MNERALWSRAGLLAVAAMCVLGVTLLATAYREADAERTLDGQVAWLNLAVLGSVVAAAGQVGLLVAGRLRVSRLRRHLVRGLAPAAAPVVAASRPAPALVVVAGGSWLHRVTCPLVAGKAWSPADGRSPVLEPCALCEPRDG